MTAGKQLAQVQPGDVLQHAAAGVDCFAVPGDRPNAKYMIAHRTPGDTTRTREVGGNDAAERLLFARAGDRREVQWLRDDVLAMLGECRFDVGEWGSGARGDDQLIRRVERDAGEIARGDRARSLHRPQHAGLGGVANNGKRLPRPRGLADRRGNVSLINWQERIAQRSLPMGTPCWR